MVSLNEPGGLLGELLPRPTSMTHSMVTSQSTCQAAAQAYSSQTARDVGVSTLKSVVGGSNREVIFCMETGQQAPPSVVSIPCTLAPGTQGVAPNSLFMCRYPSKACGILLSNSKRFLCVVFKGEVIHAGKNSSGCTLLRNNANISSIFGYIRQVCNVVVERR